MGAELGGREGFVGFVKPATSGRYRSNRQKPNTTFCQQMRSLQGCKTRASLSNHNLRRATEVPKETGSGRITWASIWSGDSEND